MTPPDPQLKGAWYLGGFNPCTYQVKTRFQTVPFKWNLHRYSTVFFRHSVEELEGKCRRLDDLAAGAAGNAGAGAVVAPGTAADEWIACDGCGKWRYGWWHFPPRYFAVNKMYCLTCQACI